MKKIILPVIVCMLVLFTGTVYAADEYSFDLEYTGRIEVGVEKDAVVTLTGVNGPTYTNVRIKVDITGPSIPKMFGVNQRANAMDDKFLLPVISKTGIKMMSINLLLENESDPVVWRGPVIAGAVKQFWTDVVWNDVDFMFVDMPPGTGDVPLTVFQSLPVDGIIVVTSPQELVSMIVGKAVKMANMMNIPVLGIVENMSYFECPDCNKKIEIFGKSKVEETAKEYGIEAISKWPINPDFARLADNGKIEEFSYGYLDSVVDKILAK